MNWFSTTPSDEAAVLSAVGVECIEDLFSCIPPSVRLENWNLPAGLSEFEVKRLMETLAERNRNPRLSFLGGGYYDHYIPAAVDSLAGRSEFYTAYTPYQPECAQGTLQAIYEYQSVICRLMDMECANASLYDGGTAVYEAAAMACRITGRRHVLVHPSLNPIWFQMLLTHTSGGSITVAQSETSLYDHAACMIVQNPSFTGDISEFSALANTLHEAGSLLIMAVNPLSLGIVKTPGAMNADIAVAEGQCLGLPLGFGGPYLGILASRKAFIRKMPGRIAAKTTDTAGRRGFVLTLQAREQHIRREKALSNICSNQALCALRALIYLCLLGKQGIMETAQLCHAKTEYLKAQLQFLPIKNTAPTFNEFVVRLPVPACTIVDAMKKEGIIAGLPLEPLGCGEPGDLLIAVTERHTREELDGFAQSLRHLLYGY